MSTGGSVGHRKLILLFLLRELRIREAFSESHKIFAFLNLANDVGKMNLVADYTKDWLYIYIEISGNMMNYRQDLVALTMVEIKADMATELPSWVPDYRSWNATSTYH